MQRARWGMARFGFFTAIALALTTMGLWPSANTRAAQTKSADPNLAEMEPRILTTADGYNLHVSWRLLEGMIAMAGLFTFAWSTGVMLMLVQRFHEQQMMLPKDLRNADSMSSISPQPRGDVVQPEGC